MVLCGHAEPSVHRVDRNRLGHEVYQIMADYQTRWQVAKTAGLPERGAGLGDDWMRLMTFRLDSDHPTVHVRTYSTYYKKFSIDVKEYAAWYRTEEMPNLSDADFLKEDDFVISLTDFHNRFSKGNWNGR